ncbi:MAG: GH32 C-terminal domain-containing protein, partial [Eudoraea sp.]|nr:GH32 C-terminal domain-containing protein [Eudoraea sp.]
RIAFDGHNGEMILDRRNSGKVDFQESFGNKIHRVPIVDLPEGKVEFRFLMDWSSLEVFVNGGQIVTTSQVFPNQPYNQLTISNRGEETFTLEEFELNAVKGIW